MKATPVPVLTSANHVDKFFSSFRFVHLSLAVCALEWPSANAEPCVTFTAPTVLTVSLTNRADVDLHWKNNATAPGGNWVEFTTPGDDYTKLEAIGGGVTTFRHFDIAPDTAFSYRIVPFFGQASAETVITTGKAAPSDTPNPEEGPLAESRDGIHTTQTSIRAVSTFIAAAPDGLNAKLASPTSVELRWHDRAADEDGYLVEVAAIGEIEFKTCALLPPDSISFKKAQLPEQTPCRFRIRAFFYGTPSNVASAISSAPPPPMEPKKAKP